MNSCSAFRVADSGLRGFLLHAVQTNEAWKSPSLIFFLFLYRFELYIITSDRNDKKDIFDDFERSCENTLRDTHGE